MKNELQCTSDAPIVKLRYFASLRDAAAVDQETLALAVHKVTNAKELFGLLKVRYRFSQSLEDMRVAINGKFADHETGLHDGDEVVFIPPVSGG